MSFNTFRFLYQSLSWRKAVTSAALLAALLPTLASVGCRNAASEAVSQIAPQITAKYTVGGSVTGLSGSGLVLEDNGGDALPVSADGPFTFATSLAAGVAYAVTVSTQPSNPSETCTVTDGSGTMGAGNVTSVVITCAAAAAQSAVIVTPALDTAHAVTMVVAASTGGTITATGADGSAFTLNVPANALLGDEAITLTPLTAVGGLPVSGGLLAGVDLAPAGLELQQPATLTIAPAASVSPDQQVGFGYHEVAGQEEFHFHPLALTSTIALAVTHFSGAGVGQGTAGNGGTPTTAADLIEQQIAQLVNPERTCQLTTGGSCNPNFTDQLNQLYQDFYTQVVAPLAQQALTDDSVAGDAIVAITTWANTVTASGASDKEPFATEVQTIDSQLLTILTNVYNRAYQRCLNDSAQSQRTGEGYTMLEAESKLQGRGTTALPDYINEIAFCLTGPLTLDIDSQTTLVVAATSATFEQDHDSHVSAQNIQLSWDPASLNYTGSGPLAYVSYNFATVWPPPGTDCSSGTGHDGTVAVTGVFDPNMPVFAKTKRVHLTLAPSVTETDVACVIFPNSPPASDPPIQDNAYESALGYAHAKETAPGATALASPYFVTVNTSGTFSVSNVVTTGPGANVTALETTSLQLVQSN
jgi:hypothetical protein